MRKRKSPPAYIVGGLSVEIGYDKADRSEVEYRRKYRDGEHNQNPLAVPALEMSRVIKNDAENCKYIKCGQ